MSIKKSLFFEELQRKFKHRGNVKYKFAYFNNSTTFIFERVIENRDLIINNNSINFKFIIGDDEKFGRLQASNPGKIGEDGELFDNDILSDIVDLLKNISREDNKVFDARVVSNVYSTEFDDCVVVDDDLLLPKSTLDKVSLFYALFKNKNINFKFNGKIDSSIVNNMYVCKKRFSLQSQILRKVDIPTKYKITCKHLIMPNNSVSSPVTPTTCNQITYCSPVDGIHSVVKCKRGHTIKDIEKATPEETRPFFIYRAKDITEDDSGASVEEDKNEDKIVDIFSLIPLEEDEFECNAVPTFNNNQTKMNYFIISYNPIVNKLDLKSNFLLKKNSHFFLDDIFCSIKDYFKTYHNQKITDQNKIICLTMILQYLCQRYFNNLYPGLGLGKTGSGKSFHFNLLSEILFDNSIVVQPTIRRNQFIGGQDSISLLGNKLFLPGYVQTKNFIFVEEMAEKIEEYISNKNNKNYDIDGNLFAMHKQCYDSGNRRQINIGIQGSIPVTINAVPFSVGNSTSLRTNKKRYFNLLKKNFIRLGGNGVPSHKKPLFKPLQYYKYIVQDEKLMNAHKAVRDEYDGFFMNGLDCAEQSRFIFYYMIDDIDNVFNQDDKGELRRRNRVGELKRQVHKKELLNELDLLFNKLKSPSKAQNNFLDVVFDYMDRWLENNPSQFMFENNDVPTHIRNNLAKMNGDLLLLHKTYFNLPLEFTEDDKKLLHYWNNFNYRLLSVKEAAMFVKPIFGDGSIDIDILENNKYVEELRLQAEEKERGVIELSEDENEDFNKIFEDEFK